MINTRDLKTRMVSVVNRKLRELLSVAGLLVLTFNVVGFFRGFLFIGYSGRGPDVHRATQIQMDQLDTSRSHQLPQSVTTIPTFTTGPRPHSTTWNGSNLRDQKLPSTSQGITPEVPKAKISTIRQPNHACLYQPGRDPNDGGWYNFSDSSLTFFAYSAFVDDRQSLLSDPVIRIIAVASKLENDTLKSKGKTLYCVFQYRNKGPLASLLELKEQAMVNMEHTAKPIGFSWQLGGEYLKEYIFTCPFRGSFPDMITVLMDSNSQASVSSCLPVEVPKKPKVKEEFGICVQASYGQLDPYRLIEWLELQRILGVSKVGIYGMSLVGRGHEVLRRYAAEGFVDLRKSDQIPVFGNNQFLLHGAPVINDCLYRNMYSFRWILVIDLDEVLVPRIHTNLKDLASFLEISVFRKNSSPVNFLFHNQYYFLDSDPDPSESVHYTTLRYRQKAPVSPSGYAMKSFINPLGCVQMHNHYCMGVAKAFEGASYLEFVPSTVAVSHHYKTCHFPTTECQQMLKQSVQDDVILNYKVPLKTNVEEKMATILKDIMN